METKITLQKNILTQNAIKVDEVTYRYNWANEKILEDEREEKTFNSLEELKSYVSTFTPLNQRLYREAKKDDEEDEEDDDEEEAAAPSPEELAGMDFEELEDVCDDHSLVVDPDDYEEEDIEKFRKAIAKELGITLPKANKETKAKGKKGKK